MTEEQLIERYGAHRLADQHYMARVAVSGRVEALVIDFKRPTTDGHSLRYIFFEDELRARYRWQNEVHLPLSILDASRSRRESLACCPAAKTPQLNL